jgi:hypothetical protein
MMEPFCLLSSTKGASAKDSLISDHVPSTISINDMLHLFGGLAVVILASTEDICRSLLPALAAPCTTIKAIGICHDADGQETRCQPMWELSIPYTRAIQGVVVAGN